MLFLNGVDAYRASAALNLRRSLEVLIILLLIILDLFYQFFFTDNYSGLGPPEELVTAECYEVGA